MNAKAAEWHKWRIRAGSYTISYTISDKLHDKLHDHLTRLSVVYIRPTFCQCVTPKHMHRVTVSPTATRTQTHTDAQTIRKAVDRRARHTPHVTSQTSGHLTYPPHTTSYLLIPPHTSHFKAGLFTPTAVCVCAERHAEGVAACC